MFDPGPVKEIDLKRGVVFAESFCEVDQENNVLLSAINFSNDYIDINPDNEVGTIVKTEIMSIESKNDDYEYSNLEQNSDSLLKS